MNKPNTPPVDLKMETTKAATLMQAIKSFYQLCGYTGTVDDNDDMIIAFDDQEIIGVMRLVNEHGVFILRGMNIREDFQRRGVGSRMFEQFNKLITDKDAKVIYCVCGAHLETYYGQLQFEKVNHIDSVPSFLVERMLGYQTKYGPQLVLRRDTSAPSSNGNVAVTPDWHTKMYDAEFADRTINSTKSWCLQTRAPLSERCPTIPFAVTNRGCGHLTSFWR